MNIKDIASLVSKGVTLAQLKSVHDSERSDELITLINKGLSFDDANEALSLLDPEDVDPISPDPEKPDPDPVGSEGTDPEGPEENWKQKYNELLAKQQLDNQRKNTKSGEEPSDQKRLEDLVRGFM